MMMFGHERIFPLSLQFFIRLFFPMLLSIIQGLLKCAIIFLFYILQGAIVTERGALTFKLYEFIHFLLTPGEAAALKPLDCPSLLLKSKAWVSEREENNIERDVTRQEEPLRK